MMMMTSMDALSHWSGRTSLVKLLFLVVCLGVIAVASYFNGIITFSLTVTLAASIVKIYKLDPDPFLLLSLHTVVTCLTLHDVPTTLAVVTAVAVSFLTLSAVQVSSDKIAVCILSMASSCLLGQVASIFAAVALVIAIIAVKLRPLQPATYCVLGFMSLSASVPVSGHLTAVLSGIMVLVVLGWYLIQRARANLLFLDDEEGDFSINNNNDNSTDNNNSHLRLMNGGCLQLCSTNETLDLHGHTVTAALKTLHQFLKDQEDTYRANRTGHTRFVKVITGEDGKNHPEDNLNLVKPTVANFLKINKYKFQVHPDRPGILRIDLESHVT